MPGRSIGRSMVFRCEALQRENCVVEELEISAKVNDDSMYVHGISFREEDVSWRRKIVGLAWDGVDRLVRTLPLRISCNYSDISVPVGLLGHYLVGCNPVDAGGRTMHHQTKGIRRIRGGDLR